jgi:hypothetical protein
MHVREQATWFGMGTNLARWEVNVVVEHHLCELQVVTRDLEACGFVSEQRSEQLDAHIVHVGSTVTGNVVRWHVSRSEKVVFILTVLKLFSATFHILQFINPRTFLTVVGSVPSRGPAVCAILAPTLPHGRTCDVVLEREDAVEH